jgi:hypothetical protein
VTGDHPDIARGGLCSHRVRLSPGSAPHLPVAICFLFRQLADAGW